MFFSTLKLHVPIDKTSYMNHLEKCNFRLNQFSTISPDEYFWLKTNVEEMKTFLFNIFHTNCFNIFRLKN